MTVGDRRETAAVPGSMRHERRRRSRERPRDVVERSRRPRYLCEALMYWRNSPDGKAGRRPLAPCADQRPCLARKSGKRERKMQRFKSAAPGKCFLNITPVHNIFKTFG